jgi:transcription elongation factor GreB
MTVCYQRRVSERKRYITPEGYEKLRAEADQLWRVERPRVTREVADAAAQGDRSENAEYIYGKKRLREIDSRVRFLNKRLEELVVVQAPPGDRERIFFGAWVTLEDEAGEAWRYRIVGPDESDASERRISMESPMGRALLGKRLDDEVLVRRPKGDARFVVVEIEYEERADPARGAGA